MINIILGIGIVILVLSVAAVILALSIPIIHVLRGEYRINKQYRDRNKLSKRADE